MCTGPTGKNKKPSCRQDSRPYCLTAPVGSRDVIGHATIAHNAVPWNRAYSKRAVQPICAVQNSDCAVQHAKLCSRKFA